MEILEMGSKASRSESGAQTEAGAVVAQALCSAPNYRIAAHGWESSGFEVARAPFVETRESMRKKPF